MPGTNLRSTSGTRKRGGPTRIAALEMPPGADGVVTGAQVGPLGVFRASWILGQELVFPEYFFFCLRPGLRDSDWLIGGKPFALPSIFPPSIAFKAPYIPSRARRPGPCPPSFNISVAAEHFQSLAEEVMDVDARPLGLSTRLMPFCVGLEQDLERFIIEAQRQTPESRKMVECIGPLIVTGLLQSVVPDAVTAPLLRHRHPGVKKALRLIRGSFTEAIPVREMAWAAGLSVSQFIVVFRRDVGWTPHEYVDRLRIQKATCLLKVGWFVTDAAFEVGFNSLCGFEDCFMRIEGVAPIAYRKAQRQ